MPQSRIEWADIGKGISIILVVYGHALYGVSRDLTITPWIYDSMMEPFALFRMPLFFFVSGIFAAFSVQRSWPNLIERPLLHLAYIFVVWNILHFTLRVVFADYANTQMEISDLLLFPIFPLDVTWFILALAIYYCLLKLLKDLPLVLLITAATAVAISPFSTDVMRLDQVQSFFIFFVLGCFLSDGVRALDWRPRLSGVLLMLFAFAAMSLIVTQSAVGENAAAVFFLKCLGVTAVIAACMWLAANNRLRWLGTLGQNTLAIFVMHTIFTGGAREILLRLGITSNPYVIVLVATLFGVLAPLAISTIMYRTGVPWMLERPHWLHVHHGYR